jgi:hypothetical protein
MPSAKQHDWHHETVTECYGVLGLLDTLLHTNSHFLSLQKPQTSEAKSQ